MNIRQGQYLSALTTLTLRLISRLFHNLPKAEILEQMLGPYYPVIRSSQPSRQPKAVTESPKADLRNPESGRAIAVRQDVP